MKILHVTDLHYIKAYFLWLSDVQSEYDVICVSGDFLDQSNSSVDSLEDQICWIQKWVGSIKIPLFLCSGNHDEVICQEDMDLDSLFDIGDESDEWDDGGYDDRLSDFAEWLHNIPFTNVVSDGGVKILDGITFGCIPYGCDRLDKFESCDVILYHVPPYGLSVSKTNNHDVGCKNIRHAIKSCLLKPKWIMCGHAHNQLKTFDKIIDVSVSNPGVSLSVSSPLFNIIEI